MAALEELTVECEFYAAIHELAIVAWRNGLTVEALLALANAVDGPAPRSLVENRCCGPRIARVFD